MPLASVFTTSYNKGEITLDAITSVLDQSFGDFEYWILENSDDAGTLGTREILAPLAASDPRIRYEEIDLTPEQRCTVYPPAMLLNQYYPKANGDYIFVLADDDVFDSHCVEDCVTLMESDPDIWCVWFTCLIGALYPGGVYRYERQIQAVTDVGLGTFMPEVVDRVDGGQVAHRRACLDHLDPPWYTEEHTPAVARHSDGLWLNRLAAQWRFHAIDKPLMTHRRTMLSLWDKP